VYVRLFVFVMYVLLPLCMVLDAPVINNRGSEDWTMGADTDSTYILHP